MSNLHEMIEEFTDKWGPDSVRACAQFLLDLRALLEAYGKASLRHESLPDTEHEHGDPV